MFNSSVRVTMQYMRLIGNATATINPYLVPKQRVRDAFYPALSLVDGNIRV